MNNGLGRRERKRAARQKRRAKEKEKKDRRANRFVKVMADRLGECAHGIVHV